jgi:iron(III) transport system substrate-binding protein
LIAAAKQEQPITVYASTGKIVQQAKAFSEQYGYRLTASRPMHRRLLKL